MKSITYALVAAFAIASRDARADDRVPEPDHTIATTPDAALGSAPSPMRALPITMLALGGAAIIGGAVALAFDEDPMMLPSGQKQPRRYTDTATPGAIAIASGVVFAGAAGFLYWKFGRVRATPSVSLSHEGATIGVVSSF